MYNLDDFEKLFINFNTIMIDVLNVSPPTLRSMILNTSYLAQNTSIMYGLLDFQIIDSADNGF